MIHIIIQSILGLLLVFGGFVDGWKYRLQTRKILKNKTAKNCSRMFANISFLVRIPMIGYGIFVKDIFIVLTSIVALYFIFEYYWTIYNYYPYHKYPKRITIKRPNFFRYIINSFQPNSKREHL